MAEIPVKRTSGGIPWWVWALVALLAVVLLFWLFSDDDEVETAAVAPVATVTETVTPVTQTAAATSPITDLTTIAGATNLSTLAGREVQLANVRVQDVVGDRTFWVGPNATQRVFVVLNEVPTPGTPTEGRYDVTPDQIINVNGVMRNIDDPAFAANPIENLPAGQQTVVHAQSLDIVQRP